MLIHSNPLCVTQNWNMNLAYLPLRKWLHQQFRLHGNRFLLISSLGSLPLGYIQLNNNCPRRQKWGEGDFYWVKVGNSCSSPYSDEYIIIYSKHLFFFSSRKKRTFWGTPRCKNYFFLAGFSLTENVFSDERAGRYRCSINIVLFWAFCALQNTFWACLSLGKTCTQDVLVFWAKPQAIKTRILYYMYRICGQTIQGPKHIWLYHPIRIRNFHHHKVKVTHCQHMMHMEIGQGTSCVTSEMGFTHKQYKESHGCLYQIWP